jgi:glycine hydroxymethyltransferase
MSALPADLPADFFSAPVSEVDPEIAEVLASELSRQENTLEMIASENFVPQAVLDCQGSVLTNKYAEGYPGRRYYGGCEHVDVAEQLAIDRAKELFGAEHANVQPHSGASANAIVLSALLEHGDTFLGMKLDHGGHLTHGMKINFSGLNYHVVPYGVDRETSRVDMDEVARLAKEHRPKMILAGWSAYPRQLDFARFREIADEVGAYLFVDMAHYAGLIAAGVYPSPIGIADFVTTTTHKTLRGPRGGIIFAKPEHEKLINSAIFPGIQGGPLMHVIAAKAVALKEAMEPAFRDYQTQVISGARKLATTLQRRGLRIVSGRTDCHMFLLDLRAKKITGKDAEAALGHAHITVNKNAIPNDPEKPFVTSGVRIGSPAMTTRGFKDPEAERLANLIADVLDAPKDEANIARVRSAVMELCRKFPVYGK